MRLTTLGLSIGLHALFFASALIPMPVSRTSCEAAKERMKRADPTMTERQLAEALPECAKFIRIPSDWIEIGAIDNLIDQKISPEPPIVETEPTEPAKPKDPTETTETPETAEAPVKTPEPPETPEPTGSDTDIQQDTAPPPSRATEENTVIIPEEEDTAPEPRDIETETKVKPREPVKEPEPAPKKPKKNDAESMFNAENDAEDDFFSTLDDINQMLDEKPDNSPPPNANAPAREDMQVQNSAAPTRLRQRGVGKRTGNTLAMQTAIRQKIDQCWDGIDGLPNPERLDVVLLLQIQRSGYLMADPKRISPANWQVGDRAMSTAIERAERAARKCEPYDMLPDEDYASWKNISITIGVPK